MMGSVAFATSGVYFKSHSLADFLLKRRPKSDHKVKKSLLKDHGLLKKTVLGPLLLAPSSSLSQSYKCMLDVTRPHCCTKAACKS